MAGRLRGEKTREPKPDYVLRRQVRRRPLSRAQCLLLVSAIVNGGEVEAGRAPHGVWRSLVTRGLISGRGWLTEEGRAAALACRMLSEKMRVALRAREVIEEDRRRR